MKKRDVVAGAVAGLVGGVVASFIMSEFQTVVSSLSDSRSGSASVPANEKAAQEISEGLFEHHLDDAARHEGGEGLHYAMGGVSGLIYGVATEMVPASGTASGLPFGAAVWLLADDLAVPLLGLSKAPAEYPFSTHIYALGSHLVYGLACDTVRRAVRSLL